MTCPAAGSGRPASQSALLLAELKRLARGGASPLDVCLWVGRSEEHRGRLAQAERSFRKAVALAPASVSTRIEWARFLEKAGRAKEASEALREAAGRALEVMLAPVTDKKAGDEIVSMLETAPFRKAFLRALDGGEDRRDRVEQVLSSRGRSAPGALGARILSAELLLARGRLAEAEGAMVEALKLAAGPASLRAGVLVELIDRGRYGRRLETALLAGVLKAEPSPELEAVWEAFSALLGAGRYPEAFRLGEALMAKPGAAPARLLWPWWHKAPRAAFEERLCVKELGRLRKAGKRARRFSRWFAYCRAVLFCYLMRYPEAFAEYKHVRASRSPRDIWMLQIFILAKLGAEDPEAAVSLARRVIARMPEHWWVRCRLAEALMAGGDVEGGLAEFGRAQAAAGARSRGDVLTWHGEALLWAGRYRQARDKLDEAVSLGYTTYVHGWRGAARLKLGDVPGALAELDVALCLDAKDDEARVWRGEALRAAGRDAEAVADLDFVISRNRDDLWARCNRGLSRLSLGDKRGLAEDFAALPTYVAAALCAELKLPEKALRHDQMARILEECLQRAKGLRRIEGYLQPLWMKR